MTESEIKNGDSVDNFAEMAMQLYDENKDRDLSKTEIKDLVHIIQDAT